MAKATLRKKTLLRIVVTILIHSIFTIVIHPVFASESDWSNRDHQVIELYN